MNEPSVRVFVDPDAEPVGPRLRPGPERLKVVLRDAQRGVEVAAIGLSDSVRRWSRAVEKATAWDLTHSAGVTSRSLGAAVVVEAGRAEKAREDLERAMSAFLTVLNTARISAVVTGVATDAPER